MVSEERRRLILFLFSMELMLEVQWRSDTKFATHFRQNSFRYGKIIRQYTDHVAQGARDTFHAHKSLSSIKSREEKSKNAYKVVT
jgi:hypothetical protein